MRSLALRAPLVCAALTLLAGCGEPSTGCKQDSDCPSGQTCSMNVCTTPTGGGSGGGGAGGGTGGGTGGGGTGGGGAMDSGTGGGGGALDAGSDAGFDAGTDAGSDTDAGTDAGMDAGTDAGTLDAGPPDAGLVCPTGFADCDNNAANGCEADLSLPAHCGACNNTCAGGQNATATCTAGSCGLSCTTGFGNCDNSAANGCEADLSLPAHCGTCSNTCTGGANATATCSAGSCGLTCATGFGNCDAMAANGCETNLDTTVTACGSCTNACTAGANQVATCALGMCGRQCTTGFDNCDANPANGCEASLASPATCGSCSNACPSGGANSSATCTAGTCGTQCAANFANCDGLATNGCEADLRAPATCGNCSNACTSGLFCGGGACSTCAATTVGTLAPNSTVMGTLPASTPGSNRVPVATCAATSTLVEDIWVFTLAQAGNAVFSTGGFVDTVLFVRPTCSTATGELACNDNFGAGTTSQVNVLLQPGTYFVIVKQKGNTAAAGGAYTLSATVTPPAPNAVCSAPTPLTSGVPVTNQDVAGAGAKSSACSTGGGGQLFYALDVPANSRALITTTPTGGAPISVVTRVLAGCSATACLANTSGTTAQTMNFDNRTGATQSVVVSVSASSANTTAGTFDLVATVSPISYAANATCAGATTLPVGGTISNETIDVGGPGIPSTCVPTSTGPVRYYAVTVPARGAVTVTGAPNGFNLGLRVLSSCAATACTAYDDNAAATTSAETLRITNPAMTPQVYVVAISAASDQASSGTYSVSAATSSPAPVANAFCDTPTALTPGTPVTAQLVEAGGNPLDAVCLPSQSGYVRYYSVNVPAGNVLSLLATSNTSTLSGAYIGARLLDACPATACLAASDLEATNVETEGFVVANASGAARSYLVAVSTLHTNPPAGNGFDVVANVYAPSGSGTCAGATPLTLGTPLVGETLTGGGAGNTACLPGVLGLTKYYRVTVAAGERVTVTGTPAGFNLALRAFDACGAGTCAGAADNFTQTTASGAERVELQNTTAAPKDYVVSVSAPGNATSGTFTIGAARTPYAVTSIAASCDDLSGAPDVLGPATTPVLGDNVVSANQALPAGFAFSYFGAAMTNFTVQSNGFAQLFAGTTAGTSGAPTNAAIPTTATPNATVAAFWDDLYPAATGRVRTAATGTAPNRVFTMEWFDFGLSAGTAPGVERLRFQAKLYETSNVVELHYCSLAANGGSADLVTGGSATVGLENSAGTDGVRFSFNTPNSVASGGGVRFTPQP